MNLEAIDFLKVMVSTFKSVHAKTGQPALLGALLQAVKEGRWCKLAEQIRNAAEDDRKPLKAKLLPVYTASGLFSERSIKGLIEHSGLLVIDVDHIGDQLGEVKRKLCADPYTAVLHLSVSGNGYAVYVRIGEGAGTVKGDGHGAAFDDLKLYYKERYGIDVDPVCRDVSRNRFVSYDPDMWVNPVAKVWVVKRYWKMDVETLVEEISKRGVDITAGYQNWRNIGWALADECGERGREYFHELSRHSSQYKPGECDRQFDAYLKHKGARRSTLATLYYLAKQAGVKIRQPLRDDANARLRGLRDSGETLHEAVRVVATELKVSQELVAPLAEEAYHADSLVFLTFWRVVENNKKRTKTPVIVEQKLVEWLGDQGFRRYATGAGDKAYKWVLVVDNVVEETGIADIKHAVLLYLHGLPFEFDGVFRVQVIDAVYQGMRRLFDVGVLETMPRLKGSFMRDTAKESFFYFRNGWLRATKDSEEIKPYAELGGLIWKSQILDMDFVWDDKLDLWEDELKGEFLHFLFDLAGEDRERLWRLMSSMGYLMHTYKPPGLPKVVIYNDEVVSQKASGGTGKGILLKAIGVMRNLVVFDGKNFDMRKSFAFQRLNVDTQVMALDDVQKNFQFERFFNIITEGIEVEKKNQPSFFIAYKDSPKIVITTNYPLKGNSKSDKRRRADYEVAPFYGPQRTPYDKFGHHLFDDWDAEEWQLFIRLMVECVQLYLTYGLMVMDSESLQQKALIAQTGPEFVEFMDRLLAEKTYKRVDRTWLYNEFLDESQFSASEIKPKRVANWVLEYCEQKGITVKTGKYNGVRLWLFYSDGQNEESLITEDLSMSEKTTPLF